MGHLRNRILVPVFICLVSLTAAEPINKQEAVTIGGIRQWISIKGEDASNPVLLHLHGGPGNSVMSSADKFTRDLQKDFVVVQWDQRESGKTATLNPSDKPLSVELMVSDAVEVIRYLSARFSKEKIYLSGHSWGGFLALLVASAHPELLEACIPMAPMVNQLESERLSLAWMTGKAKTSNNAEALRELSKIQIPFASGEQLYFHRRWLAAFTGKNPVSRDFVLKWSEKWLPLFNEASAIDLFVTAPAIGCPIYFLVGSADRQASGEITEKYYKSLKAEKKDLFWFTNSAHSLNLTEPKKLQEIIRSLLH